MRAAGIRVVARGATLHSGFGISLPVTNPKVYGYDAGTRTWQLLGGDYDMNDQIIKYRVSHFSLYGIGGDPVTATSTPASSDWSLALLGVGGIVLAVVAARRKALA